MRGQLHPLSNQPHLDIRWAHIIPAARTSNPLTKPKPTCPYVESALQSRTCNRWIALQLHYSVAIQNCSILGNISQYSYVKEVLAHYHMVSSDIIKRYNANVLFGTNFQKQQPVGTCRETTDNGSADDPRFSKIHLYQATNLHAVADPGALSGHGPHPIWLQTLTPLTDK